MITNSSSEHRPKFKTRCCLEPIAGLQSKILRDKSLLEEQIVEFKPTCNRIGSIRFLQRAVFAGESNGERCEKQSV